MPYYTYGTVLSKQDGHRTTISSTIGYGMANSEDEARGIAVKFAMDTKPDFNIMQVNVIELVGLAAKGTGDE